MIFRVPPGLLAVEQNEILHQVQQLVVREHPVEQPLRVHAAFAVVLVQPLPFREMVPAARDRAVAGAMAVADDEKGVVVKRMGDDMLVQIIPQVAVKAGADVFIDRLQLDEHQRQPLTKHTRSARRL